MTMARRSALQDISTTPYVMRVSDHDSNALLLQEQFFSASPEEQIIRQRSRRNLFQATAMEVKGNQKVDASILRGTPTKEEAFTHLTRKRLLMSPPRSADSKSSERKKPRLLRRLSTPTNLHEELKPYSTDQLVDLIEKLVSTDPELGQEEPEKVAADHRPLLAKLNTLRRAVYRAIPSTRWSSSRDAHCYRHARPSLDAFRQACVEQGRLLAVGRHWEPLVRYVIGAWRVVHQLPAWDDPAHNRCRAHCFRVLAAQCLVALKRAAAAEGAPLSMFADFRERLTRCMGFNKELAPCVAYIDTLFDDNNNNAKSQ